MWRVRLGSVELCQGKAEKESMMGIIYEDPDKCKIKLFDTLHALKCPKCKDELCFLHHDIVNVYQRPESGRDQKTTLVTITTEDNSIAVFPQYCKNISCDRGGVEIIFRCEFCLGDYALHIIQHEGHTYFGWAMKEQS